MKNSNKSEKAFKIACIVSASVAAALIIAAIAIIFATQNFMIGFGLAVAAVVLAAIAVVCFAKFSGLLDKLLHRKGTKANKDDKSSTVKTGTKKINSGSKVLAIEDSAAKDKKDETVKVDTQERNEKVAE